MTKRNETTIAVVDPCQSLIRDMLQSFEGLSHDPMARIDARCCLAYYRRRAKAIGVAMVPPKRRPPLKDTGPIREPRGCAHHAG